MSNLNTLTDVVDKIERVSELVVFGGRSGSGKTSLMNKLIELYDKVELQNAYPSKCKKSPKLTIRKAKKYTTRDSRPDDDPTEFIYVGKSEFETLANNGTIAVKYQSEGVGEVFYGWSRDELTPKSNEIVLTTANDEAVAKDLKYLMGATNIFLDVSYSILAQRIRDRGGTQEQIETRIKRLTNEHKTIAYDAEWKEQIIDMDAHFKGTEDQLEGTAHLVVENYGTLNSIANVVFIEILRLASEKRHTYRIPEQRRLKVYFQNYQEMVEIERMTEEDYVKPSGKSCNRGNLIPADKQRCEYVITVGMVKGAISGLGKPKYYVRINHAGDEIDSYAERAVMFRGGVLRPIESWGAKQGMDIWDLENGLVEVGMSPTKRSAGNNESSAIEVNSVYFDGTISYRSIRKKLEAIGLIRLV